MFVPFFVYNVHIYSLSNPFQGRNLPVFHKSVLPIRNFRLSKLIFIPHSILDTSSLYVYILSWSRWVPYKQILLYLTKSGFIKRYVLQRAVTNSCERNKQSHTIMLFRWIFDVVMLLLCYWNANFDSLSLINNKEIGWSS